MQIDPHDTRNTASDWPQGLANGHLFTHCLVKESMGQNELFLLINGMGECHSTSTTAEKSAFSHQKKCERRSQGVRT